MTVNRRELARRVAYRDGYGVGDIEEVLESIEDIIVEALKNGEDVKLGKVLQIKQQKLPEKKAWDGINDRWFIRPAKVVPKLQPLSRIKEIERILESKEEEEEEV